MEKKRAERPPSRMRGMSMLPSEWRAARSNLGSRRRWVVSSWVSMTMEEKWRDLALSERVSAARRTTPKERKAIRQTARSMEPPDVKRECSKKRRDWALEENGERQKCFHHRGHGEHRGRERRRGTVTQRSQR